MIDWVFKGSSVVYIVMQWTLWGEPYTLSNLAQAGALTIYKVGTRGLPDKGQADTGGWTLHVAQCWYLMVCKYHVFPFCPSFILYQYGTYMQAWVFTSYVITFLKYPKQWKDSSTQSADQRVKCDSITTTHKLYHLCKLKWTVPQSLSVKPSYIMAR